MRRRWPISPIWAWLVCGRPGTRPGENVAFVGLGVIGLCTAGLARAMGAKVVAISNSPRRSEAALKVGAHAAVEYRGSRSRRLPRSDLR